MLHVLLGFCSPLISLEALKIPATYQFGSTIGFDLPTSYHFEITISWYLI